MGLRNFCLSLATCFLSLLIISNAGAQEITAIDFNGDLLGKVIPDGKVVSFDNQLIGNVTADSLIVDSDGGLIGGVVPQGIAIGNDNKLLGKVNNDGSVRLSSGKIIGKVLPSGLVIDDFYNVIGSVLFPGLIYGDDGVAIGRLTGDGHYTNLQGQQVGFVSADGYAYKRINEDLILEGRLISSKMVVSSAGEFIGSVVPGGKVTNFDSEVIGSVKANGFVYSDDNKIIGRTVKSGYAFDHSGKYIGFVTYNGEIVNKDKTIGRLTSEGNVVNSEGSVIGFSLDFAATATDFTGKYLGRLTPSGVVARSRDSVGKIGPNGLVLDSEGNALGKITPSGPVFDYRGIIRAHALRSGGVITLGGTNTGSMRGDIAYDNRGRVIGAPLKDMLVIDANNSVVGIPNVNAVIKVNEDSNFVSPFGYVFSSEGNVIGSSLKLGQVYSLAGGVVASITANGELVNKGVTSVGKLTSSGINLDERNLFIGKAFSSEYAIDSLGLSLGLVSSSNLIFSGKQNVIAKILPDKSVISDNTNNSAKLSPKEGEAYSNLLAYDIVGELLGTIDHSGIVRDMQGSQIGRVTSNNQVINAGGEYVGATIGYDVAVNNDCELVGVINPKGQVSNFREVSQGKILLNRQVIGSSDKVVAHTFPRNTVIDINGNIVGTVSDLASVINYNGEKLGCLNKRGMLTNAQGQVIAGVTEVYPAMDFQGRIIGRSTIDGSIIGDNNQPFGYLQPNGNINSKTGIPLGSLFRYKVAFSNENTFLGRVIENGVVVNDKNEEVGTVDFIGYVSRGGNNIGYALYDMYVYDKDFNSIGYIAKDGNVLSFSNQNLGKLDRGFLIDKSQQLVGRGNRDFYVRDSLFAVIGELGLDGRVYDLNNNFIGSLEKDGTIVNSEGIGIAAAKPLQYYDYIADRQKVYNEEGKLIGFVGGNDLVVNEDGDAIGVLKEDGTVIDGNGNIIGGVGFDWYEKIEQTTPKKKDDKLPEVGVKDLTSQSRRSFSIALTPDGEYLGEILDDGRVVDSRGNVIGRKMPDGLIIDDDGALIGIEDAKKLDTTDMFVPAGTFGDGGAYGIGMGPTSNLGPGGGFGPGERYDAQAAAALAAAQDDRRKNISVGKISTNVSPESFDGMQKDWNNEGIDKSISSWRVDMSEMILSDKPIPAVIARSINSNHPTPVTAFVERNVYAEEGRNVIIPAGSRIIGTLGGITAGGEERTASSAKVEITWDRLIRPDGSMFRFQNSITGDAQGRGGALGYLDQQLFKRYSLPIMTTALTSYTTYLMADDKDTVGEVETSRQQAASDARQNFLNEMNSVFEQILRDKTSIRPLTYIPAGTRIIVYPNVDLWLRTPERDKEQSTGEYGSADVLIDDAKESKQREDGYRQGQMANQSAAGSVVYEPTSQDEITPLIDDTKGRQQTAGSTPPPPPPSSYAPASTSKPSGTSSSSSSSTSSTNAPSSANSGVPQLF